MTLITKDVIKKKINDADIYDDIYNNSNNSIHLIIKNENLYRVKREKLTYSTK